MDGLEVAQTQTKTAEQRIDDFLSQLGAGTPAPGGGAAAAISGALGAALVGMVAGLTVGRRKYADAHAEMLHLQQESRRLAELLLACADDDREAFTQVMASFDLPKQTEDERKARAAAVAGALASAVAPSLATMRHAISVMRAALAAVRRGNPNAEADGYVGYLLARAAFEGALRNAATNLSTVSDESFSVAARTEMRRLVGDQQELAAAFAAMPDPVERLGLQVTPASEHGR